ALFNRLPNTSVEYPYFPGYSGSGVVVEVGSGVTRFKPGDRVAGPLPHASAVVLEDHQLTAVPLGVDLTQASFLQLGIIALQGVRKAGVQIGERVAVVGQGLVGLLAVQLAACSGAYPVIALARSDRRFPLAMRLGAHQTLDVGPHASDVAGIAADVTIEASGNPDALETALACTAEGGRIVLLGSARGVTRGVDLAQISDRRLRILGAHVDSLGIHDSSPGLWSIDREARTFLRLAARGRIELNSLITDAIFPPEAELFYRRLSRADQSIVAAVFHWDRLPMQQRLRGRNMPRFLAPSASIQPRAGLVTREVELKLSNGAVAMNGSSSQREQKRTLQIGLIGCGEIALQTANAIQESAVARIAMAADVNEAIAADMGRRYNVPYTSDIDFLLDQSNVEAVLISVPHYLHAPLAIRAAERGKHVMVEKPMATSLADADRMIDACQRAGVKLSVVYCQRYLPYVQEAKRLIDAGILGTILGIQMNLTMDKPPSYFTSGFTGRVHSDWRLSREKSGGGILIFNLVHYLDIIRYLTGLEVCRVAAELDTLDSTAETEDTISVSLRYSNNAIGTIVGSSVVRGSTYQPRIQLWGTDGQMILQEPDDFRFYSLHQVSNRLPGHWHRFDPVGFGGDRRAYVTRFAESVLADTRPEISGEDGRAIQAIVEGIYRAGQRQRTISLAQMPTT
ncbi:MAG TPA: bi-domain-containing oxidoreductase, partial [Chloroflexota bacterium]|nr:bi-domain-containing oxidoreductase [Chloroflexota bacterium]